MLGVSNNYALAKFKYLIRDITKLNKYIAIDFVHNDSGRIIVTFDKMFTKYFRYTVLPTIPWSREFGIYYIRG